jgi:hypothetical protein
VDGLILTAEILTEIAPVNAALVKRISSHGRRVSFGRPEPRRNRTDRDNAENRSPRNALLHLLRAGRQCMG